VVAAEVTGASTSALSSSGRQQNSRRRALTLRLAPAVAKELAYIFRRSVTYHWVGAL